MIQLSVNDMDSPFLSLNTFPSFSYLTFVSGGRSIKISPLANKKSVCPVVLFASIVLGASGLKYPILTLTAIARKIQSGKYLSKKERCFSIIFCHLFQ